MDLKLDVDSNDPPTEVLIAAEVVRSQNKNNITISWCKEWKEQENARLYDKNGKLLATYNNDINRYFARVLDHTLYGDSFPHERTEVDHWMMFSIGPLTVYPLNESNLKELDRVLLTQTWLVGKKLTLADIHVFCALLSRQFMETFGEKYRNIARWYKHVSSQDVFEKTLSLIAKNNSLCRNKHMKKTTVEQTSVRKQEGKFIELPGAEIGKVIVRFPPEASGYLHIGHAKAALLNHFYAEAFQGQLIMRFDDTNPAKETVEFEEAILEDLKLLQIKPNRFTHTSDYFDILEEYCTTLIEKGHAFVDDTPAHIMKEQRDQKVKSKNRDNPISKNIMLWDSMRHGAKETQGHCVRAKIDYKSVNGCLRDPTIYRSKSEPHPRTGDKYKVYPTYDFACPIVDSIENVTHTLRTMEYRDRDQQFFWILEVLELRAPHIWEYSRLNMTHTVLSKRKLTWFVNEGLVDGWDDPRFPTVRGILRRGMTVEGLKQFIIAQGSSKSVVFMQWDKIWALNKKVIDPVAVRYTALEDKTIPVDVIGAKEEWLTVQNHPKDPSKGTKQIRVGPKILIEKDDADSLVEGQNATFINWGNLMIKKIEKKNGAVVSVKASLNLEDKNYKNTLKITWLAMPLAESNSNVKTVNAIRCYTVYFDHIISIPVLGKDDDFKNFVAKDTRKEVQMLGEVELKRVKKGEIIQLQRKGFFICDVPYAPISPYSLREQPVILFHIPDGHMAVPLKNSISSAAVTASISLPNTENQVNNEAQSAYDINEKIVAQGDKVRHLKADKADKACIDVEVKTLLTLKMEYKACTGKNWKLDIVPEALTQLQTANNDEKELMSDEVSQQLNKIAELQKLLDQELGKLENLKRKSEKKTGDPKSDKIQKQDVKVKQLKSNKEDKKITVDLGIKHSINKSKADNKGKNQKHLKSELPEININNVINDAKTDNTEITDIEEISSAIKKQGDKVRSLKSLKTDKNIIDQEVKILLILKNDYKNATGKDWKPATSEAMLKKKKEEQTSKSGKPLEKKVAKSATIKDTDANKTGTRLGLEAKKEENFFDWYSQIITKSGMIEYYDVSGCYILRPWSYAIWKVIKDYIDKEITALGVQECYFPIFVTRTVLEKEKTHIADFAPEVAWVTKCGESDLAEPIAIRPTSETIMYPAYAKWLKSDTELPLRLNQWNNVVRWEFKDPKPFLRTREFLWQEGHTAFATKAEADEEVLIILDIYARVYEDLLAVPVIKGRKTEKEKFAGGDYTTTVEAFISTSGRAIQGATSHHLGQNFSKMFNIQVEGTTEGDEKTFIYQNSWGMTTRTIGVMIMVHGDDKGLVLPPNVASIQAIVVPCGLTANTTVEQRETLQSECVKLVNDLSMNGKFKVKGDFRSNRTPGWKFNHWELKGVPVRIELGPKDLEKDQVTFVRRDNFQRLTAKKENVTTALTSLLSDIQSSLLNKARANLNAHIKQVENWDDFGSELNKKNLLFSPFCGEPVCEDNIKADSAREGNGEELGTLSMGAKSLCIPFEQPKLTKPLNELKCIYHSCRNRPKFYTLFGRSY